MTTQTRSRSIGPASTLVIMARWLPQREDVNDPVAQMREIILPLKRRVESRGVPFSSYVSLGQEKSEIPRHWNNPEEYAEVAEAFLTYLKTNFDFEPTFWVIYNEPDLAGFSTQEVTANIAALGPRLKQKGFNTKIQFPETETPDKAMPWLSSILSDHRVTPYLGMISFHSYDYNWREAPGFLRGPQHLAGAGEKTRRHDGLH